MRLNLKAVTKEQQKIKTYLEENASEILTEKINNGVRIQKDGKTLLNKKTLAGFMKFAYDEAKNQAEKGAHSACIDDAVVYGWAVHYFEEDSNDEEIREAVEQISEEEKAEQPRPTVSPVYQKYLDIQSKYSQAIVAMRLGDFYEVFGDNAKLLADELDLTLTGRDCGLESRVPMVGFPYHASDAYFKKILGNGHSIVLIENEDIRELPSAQNVDLETGEILSEEEMREFDGDIEESIPTVSGLLKNYDRQPKTDERLAEDISAVIDEDDFALSAFDAEAVAILSELFGDEIELR